MDNNQCSKESLSFDMNVLVLVFGFDGKKKNLEEM